MLLIPATSDNCAICLFTGVWPHVCVGANPTKMRHRLYPVLFLAILQICITALFVLLTGYSCNFGSSTPYSSQQQQPSDQPAQIFAPSLAAVPAPVLHQPEAQPPLNLPSKRSPLCASAWKCDITCPTNIQLTLGTGPDYVAGAGGNWQSDLVKFILFVMYRQLEANPNVSFLDVGANLGIFSFHVAARSFPVMAFEPMPANLFYLHKTLSSSPLLRQRVTVKPVGLGDAKNECEIWAHRDNVGNGQVTCDNQKPCPECSFVSKVKLTTLDAERNELPDFIGIAKVDIEGLEPLLFKGGLETLRAGVIPLLVMELSSMVLARRSAVSPTEFLSLIVDLGFSIYPINGRDALAYFSQTEAPQPKNSQSDWVALQSGQHDIILIHKTSQIQATHIFGRALKNYMQSVGC